MKESKSVRDRKQQLLFLLIISMRSHLLEVDLVQELAQGMAEEQECSMAVALVQGLEYT